MNKKLYLIMPMGGRGSRFSEYGFEYPKPLIEINGKPFFFWAAQSIVKYIPLAEIIFVILREHVQLYHLDETIRHYYPNAIIHVIPTVLNGAVLTCMEGIKEVSDENAPILFNDCDHMFHSEAFIKFCNENRFDEISGAMLTFYSTDPKYSYLKMNHEGLVTETREKEVISSDAICGAYYFQNKLIFKDAAKKYLDQCDYDEYFISGIYNVLCASKHAVMKFDTDYHISYGVPAEYDSAKESEKFEDLR